MTEQWQKYIEKSKYKQKLRQCAIDIMNNNLEHYDVKELHWYECWYRLRVGDIRIVYEKCTNGNRIRYIGPRGDVYKML